MPESSVTTDNFPQTGSNWTRDELISEIASYTGGENVPDAQTRAGRSLDRAVRQYDDECWKFLVKTLDITLVANTREYEVSDSNWKAPKRAVALDSDDKERSPRLHWVPYAAWRRKFTTQNYVSSFPHSYTMANSHLTGQIIMEPTPSSTLTFPKVRVDYFEHIQTTSAGVLNVPKFVEEAILALAIAINKHKVTGSASQAVTEYTLAQDLRHRVELEHLDNPDWGGW